MNNTRTIEKPLPHLEELFSHIIYTSLNYIQAPSIIINRINKTKTKAKQSFLVNKIMLELR